MIDLGDKEVTDLVDDYVRCKDIKQKVILKQKIAATCIPVVKRIARSLARRNTDPIEDLIQVGCVGLLKAIENYSQKHKTTFKTYANYFITGEIRHYLRDKVAMVRPPRELQELAFRINQIIVNLTEELNRTPSDIEVAERLSLPVAKISEITQVERRKNHVSLDNTASLVGNDSFLPTELIDNGYQDALSNKEDKVKLLEAMEMLDPKYKEVLQMSFFQDMNQKQISEETGVSQMQVSRRIKKALEALAEILTQQDREDDV